MGRWWRVWDSFWFIPAVCLVVAVILAEVMIAVDSVVDAADLGLLAELVNRVGDSGSRDLLGAIAGSTLTVAATSFSITLAVLGTASSTYGPRLVRNFMADRGNQVVLGVFCGTFLYSLLVLRSIRTPGDADEVFVPHLAVNLAVALGVLSVGVLIYFINHIADSVQVWTLARRVGHDLLIAVDPPYPEAIGRPMEEEWGEGHPVREGLSAGAGATPILSEKVGYVQSVAGDRVFGLAEKHDVTVTLEVRPGSYVLEGTEVARVWPARLPDENLADALRACLVVGRARTPRQDVEFAVRMPVEMAVRALSPSMNDPFTAINALDELSAGLLRLAGRATPSPYRCDATGQVRVIAPSIDFAELLDQVFDAMRIYAIDHPSVLLRALDLVEQIGYTSQAPAVHDNLRRHVRLLCEAFQRSAPQNVDADRLRQRASEVEETLLP